MNLNLKSGAMIAAAVAVALSSGAAFAADHAADGKAATVQCKESNSCKGKGSCAGVAEGAKHACKGQNACGGNLREVTKAECDALKGTVVTAG